MTMKIVLFSNAYPYYGETFLETELKYIPSNIKVALFPFAQGPETYIEKTVNQNVELHRYTGTKDPLKSLVACGRAAKCFLEKNEVKYALQKPNAFRNMAKALKFAYIAELRIPQIAKWIEENCSSQESIVLYSYWMYEVAYLAARLKEHFPYCKFVTRCHGYDLYEERHRNGYLPYRSFIMEKADAIFAISKQGKQYLHDTYADKFDPKITLARLGTIRLYEVDLQTPKPKKIGIVSCSNLIPLKRVDRIISALTKATEEIEWVHFGDGSEDKLLKEQAKNLPPNVSYRFMGRLPNKKIQKYYSTHRITAFVNVSETEGVPVSIMEAQSYAIPVIATDVGGTAEIVANDKNGILLNKDFTDEQLLYAIKKVQNCWNYYSAEALNTWRKMSDAQQTTTDFFKALECLGSQNGLSKEEKQ